MKRMMWLEFKFEFVIMNNEKKRKRHRLCLQAGSEILLRSFSPREYQPAMSLKVSTGKRFPCSHLSRWWSVPGTTYRYPSGVMGICTSSLHLDIERGVLEGESD